MHHLILPLCVRTRLALTDLGDRIEQAWHDRDDETGLDEAVTKMIWLGVGITVALTAGVFFTGVFETARNNVPDPIAP